MTELKMADIYNSCFFPLAYDFDLLSIPYVPLLAKTNCSQFSF
jgi:hypothetical protein